MNHSEQLFQIFQRAAFKPKEIKLIEHYGHDERGTTHYQATFQADVMELEVTPNGLVVWTDFTHRTLLGAIKGNLLNHLEELLPLRNQPLQDWIKRHPYEDCHYCGGDCQHQPKNSQFLCDGFAGDIDQLYKKNNPVPNAIYNLLHQPVIVIDYNDQTIAEGHLHPTYKFGEEQSTVIVDDYQFEPTDVFSVLCVQNETPIIRIKSE